MTTIAKIKAKLEEFEKEKGKLQIDLVEEEFAKALQGIETEGQPNEAASYWQGLHLDDDSVGEDAALAEANKVSKGVHIIIAEC